MKEKVFHGRDEHGFVIGSPQARQFQKMLEAHEREDCEGDDGKSATARADRRRSKLLRRLEKPDWWDDLDGPIDMAMRNRRFWARHYAKRAAAKLGVDVPEWVKRAKRRVSKYAAVGPALTVGRVMSRRLTAVDQDGESPNR